VENLASIPMVSPWSYEPWALAEFLEERGYPHSATVLDGGAVPLSWFQAELEAMPDDWSAALRATLAGVELSLLDADGGLLKAELAPSAAALDYDAIVVSEEPPIVSITQLVKGLRRGGFVHWAYHISGGNLEDHLTVAEIEQRLEFEAQWLPQYIWEILEVLQDPDADAGVLDDGGDGEAILKHKTWTKPAASAPKLPQIEVITPANDSDGGKGTEGTGKDSSSGGLGLGFDEIPWHYILGGLAAYFVLTSRG